VTPADDPAPRTTRKPPAAARSVAPPRSIPVFLVEDNRLLRDGLAALVRKQPGFRLVGAAPRLDTALLASPDVQPDIVLLNAGLREHHGLGAVRAVKLASPHTRIIVMGLLPAQEDIVEFVRAGVSGFILQDATFEEFVRSIRAVADGENVLPRATTRPLFSQIATEAATQGDKRALAALRVTPREREIVSLICDGLTNKEIAERFHISRCTVKSHVHNILEKLALHTRVQIATYASRPPSLYHQD
jgi:DNA-binding NarL/FixJ family response regulator